MKPEKTSPPHRRSVFQRLLKKRAASELERGQQQRQSLEGLRFAALMKQMQALQAIQGLQELAPTKPGEQPRFQISSDSEDRARQRQWLEFKADWLQATLEDTITELEALDRFEEGEANPAQESPPVGSQNASSENS